MVKNTIIILLVLLLSFSIILLVRAYSPEADLGKTEAQLERTRTDLGKTEAQLEQARANFGQTRTELEQTRTKLEESDAQLREAKSQLKQTKEELSTLSTAYDQLKTTAETIKFFFYYVPFKARQYGVLNLQACLSQCREKKEAYKLGMLDEGEMSALLEWMIENDGFHAFILLGWVPNDTEETDAWLLVETDPGKYVPVEATTFSIVWQDIPYYDDYFNYYRKFETIQEAWAYNPTEFDWWKQ